MAMAETDIIISRLRQMITNLGWVIISTTYTPGKITVTIEKKLEEEKR